ncbi:MAG: hypothetical protein KAG53_00325 [Endozoicomonadaceae bacterium]|nr:hypothetical protein [Endozoicomonadaceae bacterium]
MSRRPYQPVMAKFWYLKHASYRLYMIRELSSVFIGIWTLNLLVGLGKLIQGPDTWTQWLALQTHSLMILFSIVTLALALYHSITWFKAVPQVMRIQIGTSFVPASLLTNLHIGAMVGLSAIVLTATFWGI